MFVKMTQLFALNVTYIEYKYKKRKNFNAMWDRIPYFCNCVSN